MVEQRYDGAGYLASAIDVSYGTEEPLYEVNSRSVDLLVGDRTLGADIETSRSYFPDTGWLERVEATTSNDAYALEYQYYRDGNVKTRTDLFLPDPRVERFEFDELNRIERWSVDYEGNSRATQYAYDAGGNIKSVQVDNGPALLNVYDGTRKHLLTDGPTGSYTYDDRGRQLEASHRLVMSYTAFDLPRRVWAPSAGVTNIAYDAFGDRVRKSSAVLDTVTLERLFERRIGDQPGEEEYIFYVQSEDGPVAQIVWDPTKPIDEQQRTLFVETDALGSVGFVTDAGTGEVTRQYYDPFGARITADGGDVGPEPPDVKLGFTGHRHDDELGLIDMHGRVYDPAQRVS